MDFSKNSTWLAEKVAPVIAVADMLPGVVVIHYVPDFTVYWMSRRGCEQIGATLEEVRALSNEDYHRSFFNEEDAKDYVPRMIELVEKGDTCRITTFFQQVRFKINDDWNWHVCSSKILEVDDEGKPLLIISIANAMDSMHEMTSKAERILAENNFLRKNYALFSKLGSREREVLKLLVLGKSSGEIAEELFISAATVDTHRRNIRQKLNANNSYDLTIFAQAFNLI